MPGVDAQRSRYGIPVGIAANAAVIAGRLPHFEAHRHHQVVVIK